MNKIKILCKVGFLLVIIGYYLPVYLNLSGTGVANFLEQPKFFETFMTWFLASTMFWVAIAGLLLSIPELLGVIEPKYDRIAVLLCVGSGLILLLGVNLTIYLALAFAMLFLANRSKSKILSVLFCVLSLLFYVPAVILIIRGISISVRYNYYTYFHYGAIFILLGWLVAIAGLFISGKKSLTFTNLNETVVSGG